MRWPKPWQTLAGCLVLVLCATGFPTTVSPIYQCGTIPIYVDIDPRTLSPDIFQIKQAVKAYGKEIGFAVFAHTLGFPYMEYGVREMLGDDIPLISDCCDALGAQYYAENEWKNVGDQIQTYLHYHSFLHIILQQVKVERSIATLEELGDVCRGYTEWGRSCYCNPGQQNTCGHRFDYPDRGDLPEGWDHKYIFDRLGYNLKMTELQAGLGV